MKSKLNAWALASIAVLGLSLPALAVPTNINATNPGSICAGAPAADSLDVTFTAGDVANGNCTTNDGNLILLVKNSHAVTAYTVTVSSVADELGRTGDIATYSLAAGDIAFIGPFPAKGWSQTNGKLNYSVSNAAVLVAPMSLRGSMTYK